MKYWHTSKQKIGIERPLVMGILNVTPDSFSDGGDFTTVDAALRQAELLLAEGVDIIDVGGESTRPGSVQISEDDEIRRVVPVIRAIARDHAVPISIDTTKAYVAQAAIDAGAEIINDISGLRWDERLADVAAASGAGLVLMHSRGRFQTMHGQDPVDDIFSEVVSGLRGALTAAKRHGVGEEHIVLDVGLGFGKTFEQNLELLAKLDSIVDEFCDHPILAGASRKSFIGKLLGGLPVTERLGGSIAAAVIAIQNGATIVRVHDVKETVAAIKVASAIRTGGDNDAT